MCLHCVNVGGMENLLHVIERQRERKANRSATSSHNVSGSDVHDDTTFTVGSLNTVHDVDKSHHRLSMEAQLPKHGAMYGGDVSRLQPYADTADETVAVNHIRHGVDEPVFLRSEANSLWRKDGPPKVIPRKVASVPVSSHHGMYTV